MKNIMKSQIYQLKKSRLAYAIFFICLFLQAFSVFAMVLNREEGEVISGSSFMAYQGESVFYIPLFFLSVITGIIAGSDFMDKTTNYEIMTGHTRAEVYFGRAIPSLLVSVMGGMFLALIPSVMAGAIYGWGTKMQLSGIVVRYILLIFPYFRIVCEFIFLTFVVRNQYVIMILGYVYLMLGELLLGTAESFFLLGLTNINLLGTYHSFSTYDVLNNIDHEITVYDSFIGGREMIFTILASVLIGGFFLMTGYVFFKNDDLS